MRKNKVRNKPAVKHTISERLALRRAKRRSGPSAMRRRERRLDLQRKVEETPSS